MKTSQRIGVIDSGDVAQTVASGFLTQGREGTRETAKLADGKTQLCI
jgi:hypothetical protein